MPVKSILVTWPLQSISSLAISTNLEVNLLIRTLTASQFWGSQHTEAFLQVPLDDKEGMQLCKQDLKSSSAGR